MSAGEEVEEEQLMEESGLNAKPIAPTEGNEENEQNIPLKALEREVVYDCISMPHRLGYGFSHAFVKLDCSNKHINDISVLAGYIHLRFITLSSNGIQDLSPLSNIGHLIYLRADKNQIESIDCLNSLKYLQYLDVTENRITSFANLDLPLLRTLKIGRNKLQSLTSPQMTYPTGMSFLRSLVALDVHGNELKSLRGIADYPSIELLYCAENGLTSFGSDLACLPRLAKLHARSNAITSLDDFKSTLSKLVYINLRDNKISKFAEFENLSPLSALKALRILNNPVCFKNEYLSIIASMVPKLENIDKANVLDYTRREGSRYIQDHPSYDEDIIDMTNMEEQGGAGEQQVGEGGGGAEEMEEEGEEE